MGEDGPVSQQDDASPVRRLDLDDVELVPEQTSDDTDAGWSTPRKDPVADLRRYLDEKPPHHGD
jgi:hypothetical protein